MFSCSSLKVNSSSSSKPSKYLSFSSSTSFSWAAICRALFERTTIFSYLLPVSPSFSTSIVLIGILLFFNKVFYNLSDLLIGIIEMIINHCLIKPVSVRHLLLCSFESFLQRLICFRSTVYQALPSYFQRWRCQENHQGTITKLFLYV